MNSVALPASATKPSSIGGVDAGLAAAAAQGDHRALDELVERHSAVAWRLAHVMAGDADQAETAVCGAFGRTVRSFRRSRNGVFRTELLSEVYRSAVGEASSSRRAGLRRPRADVALVDAALRSLPDRWRAAVWLSEVESFDASRAAAVLGVSVAVANQLSERGMRALKGRFAQVGQAVPSPIGEALRSVVPAVPEDLRLRAATALAGTATQRESLAAPLGAWLEQKARAPLAVTAGALLGLGLIGVGVVPQSSSVRAQLSEAGAQGLPGSVAVPTCFGLPCAVGGGSGGPGALAGSGGTSALTSSLFGSSGGLSGLGSGSTSGAGSVSGSGSISGGAATGSTLGSLGSSGSSGASVTGGSSGSGSTSSGATRTNGGGGSGTTPSTPAPTPTASLPGVANVYLGSSGAGVTLLPSSSGSGSTTVSAGCPSNLISVSSGSYTGCSSSTGSTSSTALAPAASSSSSSSGTSLGSSVSKTISNVITTVTSLPGL